MPLSSQQIVTQAVTIAKYKGGLPTAGQLLNVVLSDLCQTYDFEVIRQTYTFNLNPNTTTTAAYPNNTPGSGPYPLPSYYLRSDRNEAFWYLNNVPYPMKVIDMEEYDVQVQQAGLQSYPYLLATDLSQSPPVFVVWPPSSGAYPGMIRFRPQMSDIGSGTVIGNWNPGTSPPESSATVPWFPNQTYLITRLAGELMKLTSDSRLVTFLGDGTEGNRGIAGRELDRYLKMKDDNSNRAKHVSLDPRRFGSNLARLPNTKVVGWVTILGIAISRMVSITLHQGML